MLRRQGLDHHGRPRPCLERHHLTLERDSASGARIKVDVTTTPSKDLTDENLSKFDVLLLNYKDTPKGTPESRWSDANKQAFLKAVHDGKGLVVYHHASSAFSNPTGRNLKRRSQAAGPRRGSTGQKHEFTVKKTDASHPISEGLPSEFKHTIDELYQNSVMVPGSTGPRDGLFRSRQTPRHGQG